MYVYNVNNTNISPGKKRGKGERGKGAPPMLPTKTLICHDSRMYLASINIRAELIQIAFSQLPGEMLSFRVID